MAAVPRRWVGDSKVEVVDYNVISSPALRVFLPLIRQALAYSQSKVINRMDDRLRSLSNLRLVTKTTDSMGPQPRCSVFYCHGLA